MDVAPFLPGLPATSNPKTYFLGQINRKKNTNYKKFVTNLPKEIFSSP
ncbi:MAG: hypothetical protein AAB729_03460 [Patescibacteria group bacterium]